MLRTSQARCHHNFRPSKWGMCKRCLCETIDEMLENGLDTSGSSNPSASTISDIIHNLRLINAAIDSSDQKMDAVLSEIEIRPLIDTFAGLLKLPNDEIGLMIAQGVQKICPRIASGPREYLMKNITNQLRKSTSLTLGMLECLRVTLLTEECLTLFLEKFGQDILPKVFHTLRSTTTAWVEGRRSSQSESNSQISSQSQNLVGNDFGSGAKDEKSKTVHVLYSIMDSTFEVTKKESHSSLDLIDEYYGSNSISGVDIYPVFVPHITDIIIDSIAQLKENQPLSVVGKVLGFLSRLLQHELALSILLKSNNGVAFCSALKRMLFSYANVIQKQTITILINMFSTYETALEVPGEHQRHIVDLPSIIQQVDLVHAISQVMNTSDPDFFRLILQLLNRWICIPFFKGKISAVVESGLRIVSVVINSDSPGIWNSHSFFLNVFESMETVPVAMQTQIVSLYSKLPCNWKPIQYLQWAKLLLHCSESNFRPNLLSFYQKALQSLKEDPYSVTCLKLFLAVSQALLSCNIPADLNEMESDDVDEIITADTLMLSLMSIKCIPTIMTLTKLGKTMDSTYVAILLQLLQSYPSDRLFPPTKYSAELEHLENFTVECGSENEDEDNFPFIKVTTQEVNLFTNGLYCKNGQWSAGAYMKILAWVRCNMELLKYKIVFDLWNKTMARLVLERYPIYLIPLANVWPLSRAENVEGKSGFLIHVFQHLELDIYKWVDVIGRSNMENSGIDPELKLQQEAILTFYYFFLLFNMNDNEGLFSSAFIPNLTILLDQLLQNKRCHDTSDWQCLSFYFKTSFLILSCLTEYSTVNMVELFETFILDVEEAMPNFGVVITFCGRVFHLLLRWNVLPMKEVTKLLERWAREDWREFQHFFLTVKFEDVLNDQEATLRNYMVTLTAYGSIETSNFMVEVVRKRQLQGIANFDGGLLQSTLADLKNEILDDTMGQMSNQQLNFSNVLELALGDDPMFCLDRTMPSEFFGDIIKILIKYHAVESMCERCLRFLLKFISSVDNLGFVRNICLSTGFVHFLGKRLTLKKGCLRINALAFELMAIIVSAVDTDADKQELRTKGMKSVRWSISSLMPFMQFCISPMSSFLQLLCALLKKDFNRSLIKVKERKMQRDKFITLLLNIQFQAQSMLHKDMDENSDLVWKFLHELLCFSERGISGTPFSTNVLMHPWNHVLISTCVLSQSSPFCLSVECLQFLDKWTNHHNHLMLANPSLFPLDYQAFSSINQFHHLLQFFSFTTDNCNRTVIRVQVEQDVETGEETEGGWMYGFEAKSSEESVKMELVDKILVSCNSFICRLPKQVPGMEDCIDRENSCFDEQMSPISCSSGSSTCSSSEFDFELDPRP